MRRPGTHIADLLNPAATLLPAANVIMQLSLPGVGYGVLESPVDSGNVYKHLAGARVDVATGPGRV